MARTNVHTVQSKKSFLEALSLSLGIVSTACTKANVGRQTYYDWMRDDPEFVKAVEIINEEMLDFVESKAMQRIQGYQHPDVHISVVQGEVVKTDITKHYPPDARLTEFILKTKGKSRGYVERKELDLDPEELKPIKYVEHGSEASDSDESVSPESSESESDNSK